jgi:hypothetical protein
MDSIRKKKKQNCSPNRFKRKQGTLLRKPWRTRRASSTRTKLIFPKNQKRKKKEKRKSKTSEKKKKKKAYHDDEMLQIRKINKRIRFDSDPRPMQTKTRNMETNTRKEGSGTPAQRSECAAAAAWPPHGGRRR